jgi:hypothetical protein
VIGALGLFLLRVLAFRRDHVRLRGRRGGADRVAVLLFRDDRRRLVVDRHLGRAAALRATRRRRGEGLGLHGRVELVLAAFRGDVGRAFGLETRSRLVELRALRIRERGVRFAGELHGRRRTGGLGERRIGGGQLADRALDVLHVRGGELSAVVACDLRRGNVIRRRLRQLHPFGDLILGRRRLALRLRFVDCFGVAAFRAFAFRGAPSRLRFRSA